MAIALIFLALVIPYRRIKLLYDIDVIDHGVRYLSSSVGLCHHLRGGTAPRPTSSIDDIGDLS